MVFLSDMHIPFQNHEAIASALKMVRSVKPHRVVLNGDVADFFQLSRFNTSGARLDSLQEEIDEANAFRAAVRKAAPNAQLEEVDGNHDSRIRSYVGANAPALRSLREFNPETLFKHKELDIRWHPGAGFRLREDFIVKHGTVVRGEAGASAKGEHLASGVSGISGHTHRLATYRRGGYVQRQWTEQGCLCSTEPDYVVGIPSWQVGCAVGEFSKASFTVHEVPFVEGTLRLGLKRF